MVSSNTKSDSALRPSKTQPLTQQLAALDQEMYNLLACYHVYQSLLHGFLNQTEPEFTSKEWLYGLSLVNDWLDGLAQQVREDLQGIRERVEVAHG